MGAAERWWIASRADRVDTLLHSEQIARDLARHGSEVVEVVPTVHLRVAVDALGQIRDLLGELQRERLTVAQVAAAHRIASDAADHLGGVVASE
jgi:hypothetical protein